MTFGLTTLFDQGTKWLVEQWIPEHPKIQVQPGLDPSDLPWMTNLHHNGTPGDTPTHFGMALAYLFMTAFIFRRHNLQADKAYQAGLGILGGVALGGNALNHVLQGYTVDFLHIPGTFLYTNFSDIFGLIGFPLFIWRVIVHRGKG